jgi:resuscitation-promoting factor RpfA
MAKKSYLPRKATAVLATLGAATVTTVALAGPADAATRYAVWNRVAQCESSGRWHIVTGNGFYGGLQFTASTWRGFGGHIYARQASGASRLEQIAVARRVLAAQGPRAWPVCGPRAGLTRRSGHATSAALPRWL